MTSLFHRKNSLRPNVQGAGKRRTAERPKRKLRVRGVVLSVNDAILRLAMRTDTPATAPEMPICFY